VLQELLESAWVLEPEDRDMIVMWHRFGYTLRGENRERISALRLDGRDSTFTAMSDTVGMPMLLAAEVLLEEGGFGRTGVEAPMDRAYYDVLLPRLEAWGVRFEETDRAV
jgi:saccharopine dehydrogenase-like NADP-dependent oxidoreductase